MKIVVQKFGGSSLATSNLRALVVHHVQRVQQQGYHPVIVVSAMGRTGDPYATDTLIGLAESINGKPSPENLDLLMSCGENISAVVMAETLQNQGITARAVTGWQAGIVTDGAFSDARVVNIKPDRIRQLLEAGIVPVVAGFQGMTPNGEITTLGRGGSDTTAAALGAVLDGEMVEIYTDVDGVKTADPRLIPKAPTLTNLTYREVAEMAHLGAKVIHPRAVEVAMEKGIPLKVLSTASGAGTLISSFGGGGSPGGEPVRDRVVTGIAHLPNRAQVQITGPADFNKSRLALRIFDVLAKSGISVDLIYLSPNLIAFIIDQEKSDLVKEVLQALELNIKVETGFAKVSAVGAGMHGVPGVMARVVGCLEEANVAIYQTTDSHANISCLIKEEDLTLAVRALHHEFQLSLEGGSKE